MTNHAVVALEGVTKRFAAHTAVRQLSLGVSPGSIYGLLGPNGAGKTTTMRMIMNIIAPDEGTVRLFGEPSNSRDLSARIGYLPEERGLYKRMKVLDVLVFLAETKGIARRTAKRRAGEWLERLGLADWSIKKVDDLSKGMQQKVQFISTVLHDPNLLILDEPFSGLDPVNSQVMKDTVLDLARKGATVLFSTHIMEHAEKLCDSVCIIARGEKVVDGPLADVKRRHSGRHVIVAVERGSEAVDRVLADRSLVGKAHNYGQYAEVELADGGDPQRLLTSILAAGARISRFEVSEATLNQVFIDLVGPEAAQAAARPEV
jgi:ABC-2 type transport system ATP-binding protein